MASLGPYLIKKLANNQSQQSQRSGHFPETATRIPSRAHLMLLLQAQANCDC